MPEGRIARENLRVEWLYVFFYIILTELEIKYDWETLIIYYGLENKGAIKLPSISDWNHLHTTLLLLLLYFCGLGHNLFTIV